MATSKNYATIAKRINKELKVLHVGELFAPLVSVIERGSDGLLIIMNDDAYDIAQFAGYIQDMFYTDTTFVVGDHDFYLEPFDSMMAFKVAE